MFACRDKQKRKEIRLFFGRIYGAPICFWFYLTFIKAPVNIQNIGFYFHLILKVIQNVFKFIIHSQIQDGLYYYPGEMSPYFQWPDKILSKRIFV